MVSHGEFHNGSFDGVWVADKGLVFLFLTAYGGRQVTAVLADLLRLNAGGFREGNIILDLTIRDHNEVTLQGIVNLCDAGDAHEPQAWESKFLEQINREGLRLLEVSSSYGGTCLALAKSIEFLDRSEWVKRYLVQG